MEQFGAARISDDSAPISQDAHGDALSELGRATTAYHDALPDQLEYARIRYEIALRDFKSSATDN